MEAEACPTLPSHFNLDYCPSAGHRRLIAPIFLERNCRKLISFAVPACHRVAGSEIRSLLQEADPDVCLVASQYSLIEHANALNNVFPVARQPR
jgi:hypothetical protein